MAVSATHKKTIRGFIVAYGLASLVMIYLSYRLPLFLPGDFTSAMYGGSHVVLTLEQESDHRRLYAETGGFVGYLADLASMRWGYSYAFRAPVSRLILEALPWTLLLAGSAHLLSMLFGFVLGVEAAWRRGRWFEKRLLGAMSILQGLPEIVTGVFLLFVFALLLQWFPAAGATTAYANLQGWEWIINGAHHLVLPLTTLVLSYFPGNFLLARGSMVLILKAPFTETARAKGLPPFRIRYAHAARNALLPLVTRFGLRLALLVTGVVVVENIYSYPGLGTLLLNAIGKRDLPLIQGVVLFSSLMIMLVNLLLDISYRWIDPRVTYAQ